MKCTLQPHTIEALEQYVSENTLNNAYLFPAKKRAGEPLCKIQYYRLVKRWVARLGLNPDEYGTHSLRRTRVANYYERTKDIRTCQIALGHTKITQTADYLDIEETQAIEKLKQYKI